jgi:hypothetical protein
MSDGGPPGGGPRRSGGGRPIPGPSGGGPPGRLGSNAGRLSGAPGPRASNIPPDTGRSRKARPWSARTPAPLSRTWIPRPARSLEPFRSIKVSMLTTPAWRPGTISSALTRAGRHWPPRIANLTTTRFPLKLRDNRPIANPAIRTCPPLNSATPLSVRTADL